MSAKEMIVCNLHKDTFSVTVFDNRSISYPTAPLAYDVSQVQALNSAIVKS